MPAMQGIGHFRVPFTSVSKPVQVRNLSYENKFYSQVHSNANQTYFRMKGFALRLVLRGKRELRNGLFTRLPLPQGRTKTGHHRAAEDCNILGASISLSV